MVLPRRFALIRHTDYTRVSGIGVVAYGVAFSDGQVVLRWGSTHPATSMWGSMDDMLAIHGDGEATSVEWIDAPFGEAEDFPADAGRPGRRRVADPAADPTAGHSAAPHTGTGETPAEQVVPQASPETSPAAPAEDPLADASGSREESSDPPEPLPRRIPGSVGVADDPASTESTGSRGLLDQGEPPATRTAPEPAVTDQPTSPPRDRRILRPVRTEQETAAAPLLTSDDPDSRNGHLYIDTAPLLLTFSEPDDEPVMYRPHRRGGRHRRADPDAAG